MKKLFYILPCLALAFASCSNDTDADMVKADTPLRVNTYIPGSRAMITETSMPDGASMGITVVKNVSNAVDYDGMTEGYTNIEYKASGEVPDQSWTAVGTPIYLSATEGKVVAYYPYKEGQDDYNNIVMSAAEQEDYMYSGWVSPVSNANSEAKFEMKHAMTGVRVRLKKGNYTLAGKVTEIKMQSDAFGVEGTLDAITGTIKDVVAGEINTNMLGDDFSEFTLLSDLYTSTLLMAVPVLNTVADINFTIEVDTKKYQAVGKLTVPMVKGNIYTFDLILNNTALSISSEVSVTPWLDDEESASTENGGVLVPGTV